VLLLFYSSSAEEISADGPAKNPFSSFQDEKTRRFYFITQEKRREAEEIGLSK